MNKKDMLYRIQKYNFAAYDLLLYLDTHPEDRRAFTMFKAMVKEYKALVKQYEAAYGPLEAYNAAGFDTFRWTESPWPWEKEANV